MLGAALGTAFSEVVISLIMLCYLLFRSETLRLRRGEQFGAKKDDLRRAAKLLEPKNLKRLGLAAAGGSVLLSALGTAGRDRIYRAAVARELKKQLEPVNKKLDALEQQNEELRRQNEELQRQLVKA